MFHYGSIKNDLKNDLKEYINIDCKGTSHMGKNKKYVIKSLISLFAATTLIMLNSTTAQEIEPEVPFVSTPLIVVEQMLKMVQVGKDDVLFDLGCGDGRIVIAAAKKFGCQGIGIDIDPERIRDSRKNAIEAGVQDRVQFNQMDLFQADFSKATVVTLYLLTEVNLRLRPILLRQLKPGTRVVSHEFSMGKWEPDVSTTVSTGDQENPNVEDYWDLHEMDYWDSHQVYFWIIPANVAGTWKVTIPDITGKNELTLKLDQEFQRVRGEAFEGTSPIPVFIKDEKIKGNILQFTMERKLKGRTESMHFEGRVQDNIMQGTLKIEGRPGKEKIQWKARRIN
jgi:SAM-dependent methyltransferase